VARGLLELIVPYHRHTFENVDHWFWPQVQKTDGCWLWTGAQQGVWRYGSVKMAGHHHQAHRVSWALANGPIPGGLFVLHHCDVTTCVRPSHLYLGTAKDNQRDCIARGHRSKDCHAAPRVFCKHGHAMTGENVAWYANAARGKKCRACRACRKQQFRDQQMDPVAHMRGLELHRRRRALLRSKTGRAVRVVQALSGSAVAGEVHALGPATVPENPAAQ
jgi:hypothetical protein